MGSFFSGLSKYFENRVTVSEDALTPAGEQVGNLRRPVSHRYARGPEGVDFAAIDGSKVEAVASRTPCLGSFAVEKFGLDRLRHLKRSEIHARARHFAKLTQFKL